MNSTTLLRGKRPTATERFGRGVRVDPDSGCWLWTGAPNSAGYGQISVGGRKIYTHRWAYETYVGPIPDGRVIDHLCRNTMCCNPEHLEAVPQRTNMLRGVHPSAQAVSSNHCKRGHEFTPANTYRRLDRPGRQCRECRRIRDAAASARRGATT